MSQVDKRERSLQLVNRVTLWLAGGAAIATAAFGFAAAHENAARHGSTSPASVAATDDSSGDNSGFFATPSQPPSQSFAPTAAVSGGS
jgi:hypothetical protein